MITANQDTFDVMTDGRRLLISQEDNALSLGFRFVSAGFFLPIGLMVLWLFIGGGGPSLKPDSTSGQKMVAIGFAGLFFVGFGVGPLCLGLGILFFRDRFVFDTEDGRIESHITVFGRTIRRRDFNLRDFDSVVAGCKRLGGGLTGHIMFAVEFQSSSRTLFLVGCRTRAQASELASRIARHTGLSYCDRSGA